MYTKKGGGDDDINKYIYTNMKQKDLWRSDGVIAFLNKNTVFNSVSTFLEVIIS